MIAANKQNLLSLKKQKKNLLNGLRLLKEKRSSLIILFLKTSKEGKELEIRLSLLWQEFLSFFKTHTSLISQEALNQDIDVVPSLNMTISKKRITGVYIDKFSLLIRSPIRSLFKEPIQSIFKKFNLVFPDFVELAQLKSNSLKISREIIKTKRQINNLENKIVDISQNIKYIQNSLQEKSNSEKAILIKLFG
jgi:vacuolar-type H+-ATPase subunit D/Vma8